MKLTDKIYVAGHEGLVGSSIIRQLNHREFSNIITKTKAELDLTRQNLVEDFFNEERPDYVFLAAAKVGGIHANNSFPSDFALQNIQIQTNVIHSSYKFNVKKLLFLGSSCIYPKYAEQPISENSLLTSSLEPTNEAYAIAKISGIKLCQYFNRQYGTNFISCMPTNLYGINDNFDLENSHVIPALIRKFLENKNEVVCWGDGTPFREFLYVDDLADACIFLMENYNDNDIINVGTGKDIQLKQLVELISKLTGFSGKIVWDTSKPNGTPRKVLNVDRINKLGWISRTDLKDGLMKTIEWYRKEYRI